MIDLNHIVNIEILKARMAGINDFATELLEIFSKGGSVSEWNESREEMIKRCQNAQDNYKNFLQDLGTGKY